MDGHAGPGETGIVQAALREARGQLLLQQQRRGRVLQLVLRAIEKWKQFVRMRVLRRHFHAWNAVVWVSRHEWKLNLIAATRYRLLKMQRSFHSWRTFIFLSRFCKVVVRRRILRRWVRFARDSRSTSAVVASVQSRLQVSRLRTAFSWWKLLAHVCSVGGRRSFRRCWAFWKHRAAVLKEESCQIKESLVRRDAWLLRNAFSNWRAASVENRWVSGFERRRLLRYGFYDGFLAAAAFEQSVATTRRRLLSRWTLHALRACLVRRRRKTALTRAADERRERLLLKGALMWWRSVTAQRKMTKEEWILASADSRYQGRLLATVLHCWRALASRSATDRARMQRAQEFHRRTRLRSVVRAWIVFRKERREEQSMVLLADKLHAELIRRKYFRCLEEYARHRRARDAARRTAVHHLYQHALAKALRALRWYTFDWRKRRRQAKEDADDAFLGTFFRRWKSAAWEAQQSRLFEATRIMKEFWSSWRQSRQTRLLERAMRALVDYYHLRVLKKLETGRAIAHFLRVLQHRSLHMLRAYAASRRRKGRAAALASRLAEKSCLQKFFAFWMLQLERSLFLRDRSRAAQALFRNRSLRHVLGVLKGYKDYRREKRLEEDGARSAFRSALVAQGISRWIAFSAAQRSHRLETAASLHAARAKSIFRRVESLARLWRQKALLSRHRAADMTVAASLADGSRIAAPVLARSVGIPFPRPFDRVRVAPAVPRTVLSDMDQGDVDDFRKHEYQFIEDMDRRKGRRAAPRLASAADIPSAEEPPPLPIIPSVDEQSRGVRDSASNAVVSLLDQSRRVRWNMLAAANQRPSARDSGLAVAPSEARKNDSRSDAGQSRADPSNAAHFEEKRQPAPDSAASATTRQISSRAPAADDDSYGGGLSHTANEDLLLPTLPQQPKETSAPPLQEVGDTACPSSTHRSASDPVMLLAAAGSTQAAVRRLRSPADAGPRSNSPSWPVFPSQSAKQTLPHEVDALQSADVDAMASVLSRFKQRKHQHQEDKMLLRQLSALPRLSPAQHRAFRDAEDREESYRTWVTRKTPILQEVVRRAEQDLP